MMPLREVKTCDRCRQFKRRCDQLRPSCTRCQQARVQCSFESQPAPAFPFQPSPESPALGKGLQASTFSPGGEVGDFSGHGLISPSSTDLGDPPQPMHGLVSVRSAAPGGGEDHEMSNSDSIADTPVSAAPSSATTATAATATTKGKKVVRKRKRNWISCLRCHRLKVKCDKELPCGRCATTGNGRECYYTYNKGPNAGKFPCPTVPPGRGTEITESTQATWQVSHESRGASHWRDLMTKVSLPCLKTQRKRGRGVTNWM